LDGYNSLYFCPLNTSACGTGNATWNQSLADLLYYSINNPFNFINYTTGNTTDEIFAVCDNSTFLKSFDELDPWWEANYTALNNSWSSTFNSTYDDFVTANVSATSNNSLYCYGKSEVNLNVNDSIFLNGKNGNYYWNITGGIPSTNISITQNLNMSNYNTTYYQVAEASPVCSKYYNSTGILKWCDCYNSTHKWMANSC
jgi:hypothetical protein